MQESKVTKKTFSCHSYTPVGQYYYGLFNSSKPKGDGGEVGWVSYNDRTVQILYTVAFLKHETRNATTEERKEHTKTSY